jgi:predicted transcriptional regulator
MPETPETHEEIIEIKREVREIRQTLDAAIHLDRQKWEEPLLKFLQNNSDMMRVLLAIDGNKSAKDLEKECGLYQVKCWRILDKLLRKGIINKLEETKKGSPIFMKTRWYTVLRLDEKVQKKLASQNLQPKSILEQNDVDNKQSEN